MHNLKRFPLYTCMILYPLFSIIMSHHRFLFGNRHPWGRHDNLFLRITLVFLFTRLIRINLENSIYLIILKVKVHFMHISQIGLRVLEKISFVIMSKSIEPLIQYVSFRFLYLSRISLFLSTFLPLFVLWVCALFFCLLVLIGVRFLVLLHIILKIRVELRFFSLPHQFLLF